MCQDCGCSVINNVVTQTHHHQININQSILSKNDRLAEKNRSYFKSKRLLVLNLLSSPGSGKTALIEKIVENYSDSLKIGAIVGDLATDNDARRLQSTGIPTIQITTGNACHLEADMVAHAANQLDLNHLDLLIIENVGNLVCPAAYDLGEHQRIAILSVTEGEDKPLKYPTLFKTADVVIINKIDIAQAVEFNQDLALNNIKAIAPQSKIFLVSARTGEGMQDWYEYIASQLEEKKLIEK